MTDADREPFSLQKLLGEATLLALLTFAGYSCAWGYEVGFAMYYGIPIELIRIDNAVLAFALIYVLAVTALLSVPMIFFARFDANKFARRSGYLVMPLMLGGLVYAVTGSALLGALLAPLFSAASHVVRYGKRKINRLLPDRRAAPASTEMRLPARRGARFILPFVAVEFAMAMATALMLGQRDARTRTVHLTHRVGAREVAALRFYGDMLVSAPLAGQELQPELLLQKVEADPVMLTARNLGVLRMKDPSRTSPPRTPAER